MQFSRKRFLSCVYSYVHGEVFLSLAYLAAVAALVDFHFVLLVLAFFVCSLVSFEVSMAKGTRK